jgi:predicted AAA+ superfamily ATPase
MQSESPQQTRDGIDVTNPSPDLDRIVELLDEIARSLAVLSGREAAEPLPLGDTDAYQWSPASNRLNPVRHVNRVELALLKGIDNVAGQLVANTVQFRRGHGANNALLWGARGMGKSSLVKAVHAHVAAKPNAGPARLVLIEIHREDIETLPRLMAGLADNAARHIVFCDDLSFEAGEATYRSLKTILDGGLEGRPDNTLFYATSNRRHLMPREMIENERSTAINPAEAAEEKISLSDRFGLWLGFHQCDQAIFLEMVEAYVAHFGIRIGATELRARAIEWSATRGARSGRVAIQFVRQLAGEKGQSVDTD